MTLRRHHRQRIPARIWRVGRGLDLAMRNVLVLRRQVHPDKALCVHEPAAGGRRVGENQFPPGTMEGHSISSSHAGLKSTPESMVSWEIYLS